jgi:hypothetical protein
MRKAWREIAVATAVAWAVDAGATLAWQIRRHGQARAPPNTVVALRSNQYLQIRVWRRAVPSCDSRGQRPLNHRFDSREHSVAGGQN